MNYVYDIETLSNCFTAVFAEVESGELNQFVIHESRNDAQNLREFLRGLHLGKAGLIGFNNRHFDWPILHYFIGLSPNDPDTTARILYAKAQSIISNEQKTYAEEIIKQLDLYLINHYDNKNRSTSLKALQCSIKWPNVQDMPIHHSDHITAEMIPTIIDYNINDVLSTRAFFNLCTDKIELRKKLGSKFKQNFINRSDVSIGESIFVKFLAEKMGRSSSDIRKMKSPPSRVPLKDIIFPYIKFRTPEFNKLFNKFLGTTMGKSLDEMIHERIDAKFKDEEKTTEGYLEVLESLELKARQEPESKKKKSFGYSLIFQGVLYEYGIGGVHGCTSPGIYEEDDKYLIVDSDVASYYPNLSIRNGLRPRHFPPSFCEVYEDIFDQRLAAKRSGDKIMADGLKLSLNGIFGKSLDKFSPFFDPWFFAGITVNGQLCLSMFAEGILTTIKDSSLLQINTDGACFRIPRSEHDKYLKICARWEEITRFELEHTYYKKMILRDVNNYLAVTTDGKNKEKGAFETVKEWHKDPSFAIIPIAVGKYFTHGTPIMDTLKSHTDIYDFCGRYKATPGFSAHFVYLKNNKEVWDNYGKMLRFLPVKKGGVSMKVHKDGRQMNLLEGWPTQVFNKYTEIKRSNINYDFFYNECVKMIKSVEIPQQDLFR